MQRASLFGSRSVALGRGRSFCICHLHRLVRTQAGKGFAELLELRKNKKGNDNGKLKPHTISPRLLVPGHIPKPPYVDTGEMPWGQKPQVHSKEDLVKMRAACRLAAEVLQYAGNLVKPGITTDFIDRKVHQMIIDSGAYPSPLSYGNFPKSVCTSVNECVCHGIPDSRELREGDIINIDVTVYLNGYHGDTSRMFYAGEPSPRARWLCDVTKEAMYEGIKQCGPDVPINAVGKAIHSIADRHKLGVVADFVGHGVGQHFHSMPMVHATRNNVRAPMVPGQTFTIEPIFVDGSNKVTLWKDQWTVVTKDGSLTAQHEHTILITDDGHEILTQL